MFTYSIRLLGGTIVKLIIFTKDLRSNDRVSGASTCTTLLLELPGLTEHTHQNAVPCRYVGANAFLILLNPSCNDLP